LLVNAAAEFMEKHPGRRLKLEAEHSNAIFEGIPQRFALQWSILDAKDGELIPADVDGSAPGSWPHMGRTHCYDSYEIHFAPTGE
jgi:hypothetical protein